VVSIGDLGDDSRLDVGRDDRDIPDENLNDWEVSQRLNIQRELYLIHGLL